MILAALRSFVAQGSLGALDGMGTLRRKLPGDLHLFLKGRARFRQLVDVAFDSVEASLLSDVAFAWHEGNSPLIGFGEIFVRWLGPDALAVGAHERATSEVAECQQRVGFLTVWARKPFVS